MAENHKGGLGALSEKIKEHAASSAAAAESDTSSRSGKLGSAGTIASGVKPKPTSGFHTANTAASAAQAAGVKPAASTVKPTASSVKPAAASVKPTASAAAASSAKPTAASVKPTATSVKPTAAHVSAKSAFTDVPADAYYAKAVDWAVRKGITSGTTETTFAPDNPCHRGHAATFLWRAKGSPAPGTAKNPFKDVSDGPFYQAILWASAKNIIPGATANTFEPGTFCTRAQVLSYMRRAEGKIDATEKDAALWATTKDLLSGQPGGINDPCTRADIVYYLYRLYGKA